MEKRAGGVIEFEISGGVDAIWEPEIFTSPADNELPLSRDNLGGTSFRSVNGN